MNIRVLLSAAIVASWLGCQCGGTFDPCAGVKCGPGLECSQDTGKCGIPGFTGTGGGTANTGGGAGGATGGGTGGGETGGGTGGGVATGTCSPVCTSAFPVCDATTNACVTCNTSQGCAGTTPYCEPIANGGKGKCFACTDSAGCSGATPFCDLTALPAGQCVGCRTHFDCTGANQVCDFTTNTCVVNDGGVGGGAGGGGGTTTTVTWNDGGLTANCLPTTTTPRACTTECDRGFECVGGQCLLRGTSGGIQVTLRFPDDEDLDLHLEEPLRAGGTCDIYYGMPNGNPNPPPPPIPLPFPLPPPRTCGSIGWLDLDSNAACNIDGVNIENVIYPPNVAVTAGLYTVRVDYYQNCSASRAVPYEVEVRAANQRRYFCGTFQPGDADSGGSKSGRVITTFTIQ